MACRLSHLCSAAAASLALLAGGCSLGSTGELASGSISTDKTAIARSTQTWTCDMLRRAVDQSVEEQARLELAAKKEQDEAPKSLSGLFSGAMGQSKPSSEEKIARTRTEVDAYNAQLKAKGCGTVDIKTAMSKAQADESQKAAERANQDFWAPWRGKGSWMHDWR